MPTDRELEHAAIIALAPLVELNISVQVRQGVAYLIGVVDSLEQKKEARRLVSEVPGIKDVVDQLTIDPTGFASDSHIADLPEAEVLDELEVEDVELGEESGVEPSFTGDVETTDVTQTAEQGRLLFPPTDPVEHDSDRDHQGMKIVGGWAPTSMTEPIDPDIEPGRFSRSDYEIREDVIMALREDAATQDLDIRVSVRNGTVHLHGTVPSLDDAENAEEVAARVDGVLEVVEALDIEEPYIR